MFIDASKEFEKGKDQNILRDQDIDKIVQTYIDRVDVEKYAHVASMNEIVANEYNLNIPRYVDTSDPEPEIDLDKVFTDINKTNEEIAKATADLNVFMKELGLQELK